MLNNLFSKIIPLLLTLGFASLNAWSQHTKLVFEDDFDGTAIDGKNWLPFYPWGHSLCGNDEIQYYQPENIQLRDGALHLISRKENKRARTIDYEADSTILCKGRTNLQDYPFTSGLVLLQPAFLYGTFEIRCKVPGGRGVWPAFWLFGDCDHEIDVFEFFDGHTKVFGTNLHGNVKCDKKRNTSHTRNYKIADASAESHTYTLKWTKEKIEWLIDGKLIRRTKNKRLRIPIGPRHIFPKNPLHLILNTAITPQVFEDPAGFPKEFVVEYVRIWQ